MKRRQLSCLRLVGVAGTALLCAPCVLAQEPATGDRTGPEAGSLKAEFAEESPELSRPIAEPAEPAEAVASGTVLITGVKVTDEHTFRAEPRKRWTPPTSALGGVSLSYTPDELLDAAWVERQFYHNTLVDRAIGLDRLVSLVQLINRALVENGYINSGVLITGKPPSDGGVLLLRLVAGSLTEASAGQPSVRVEWGAGRSQGLAESFVIERLPAATARPLNIIDLEREFRLLADHPAISTLSADLEPGARPGEAQLALTAYPEPRFDLFATAANSRSPAIGGERYGIGGSVHNLLASGDIVSAEGGLTAGEYDWNLAYEAPIVSDTLSMRIRGGENRAAVVDGQLQPLDITASDWQLEGALIWRVLAQPLTPGGESGTRKPARSLDIGIGAIHREALTTLLGEPFSFTPGAVEGRARYTALRLTADFISRNVDTVLAASLTATQGLDGSRSDLVGLISPERDFQAYRAQLSYARRLTDGGLELRLRTAGQWASGILYAGERFAAGGARTVRGYRETLSLADTGLLGSIELAQGFSLSKRSAQRRRFDPLRFSASIFADGAVTGNREGPPAIPDELASIGATLSWRPSPAIDARLIYGEALIDVPLTGTRDLQDRGISFSVVVRPLEWFR